MKRKLEKDCFMNIRPSIWSMFVLLLILLLILIFLFQFFSFMVCYCHRWRLSVVEIVDFHWRFKACCRIRFRLRWSVKHSRQLKHIKRSKTIFIQFVFMRIKCNILLISYSLMLFYISFWHLSTFLGKLFTYILSNSWYKRHETTKQQQQLIVEQPRFYRLRLMLLLNQ